MARYQGECPSCPQPSSQRHKAEQAIHWQCSWSSGYRRPQVAQQTLTENSLLFWSPKVFICRDYKGIKSPSANVQFTWINLLRSGKGPQFSGSNWKSLLVFILAIVSVLEESVHFVQSATPDFALKVAYLLFPWFRGVLSFLIAHDDAKHKPQNITMKNTQTSDNQHTENINVLTLACRPNRLWPVMTKRHNVVMQTLEVTNSKRYHLEKCLHLQQ